MPQRFDQVAGGSCSLTMYPETSPGVVANGTKGVRLSFMNESFAKSANKRQRNVITGRRGAGKPFEGMPKYTGQAAMASYSPQMGHLFRALCGDAATSADPVRSLDAAAVTQVRSGIVGLPSAGHGFVQDTVITVRGTANYDGTYRVAYGVTENVIAIQAPYEDEVIPTGATVCRGRAPFFSGEARDLGGDCVGLPVVGGFHSLNEGESVVISGTTNYDGVYVLQAGSVDGVLVVQAVYAAETFDGTAAATPKFYRHTFVLPKRQPTVAMEKYLDFEDGATLTKYQRFGFCKVNGISFSLGGDDELVITTDFAVGMQEDGDSPLDAAPVFPPSVPMDNIEAAIWIAGERCGDVETASISNTFGIEAKAAIGDLGKYSRMPEGDPTCQHSLSIFLEDGRYQEISTSRATIAFSVSVSCAAGDELWINYPETELDVPGTSISGKEGLMQDVTVMAFVDRGGSVMNIELINRVASYAA